MYTKCSMKIYCRNCGSPNEYVNHAKPNFCSACGNAFSGGGVKPAQQASASKAYAQEVKKLVDEVKKTEEVEEQDEAFEMPNISRLSFSYDKSFKDSYKTDIKSLASMHGPGYTKRDTRQRSNQNEAKYSLEDFFLEAGNLSQKSSDED